MKLFKPTQIEIKGQLFDILLMGEDEIYFDIDNETFYYNLTKWITGDSNSGLIDDLTKLGVNCIVTYLEEETFNNIIHSKRDELAKYLTSNDEHERFLSEHRLKCIEKVEVKKAELKKKKDEAAMEKSTK